MLGGLILSLVSFAETKDKQETKILPAAPTAQNGIPTLLRSLIVRIKQIFGIKRRPIICPVPNVTNLTLSRTEITTSCAAKKDSCPENLQSVEVIPEIVDPANNVLLYVYKVSGGEIVGSGAKVTWNLSGVKPGTYTITAGVDDGCGVCGLTQTREIKVIECPNCN